MEAQEYDGDGVLVDSWPIPLDVCEYCGEVVVGFYICESCSEHIEELMEEASMHSYDDWLEKNQVMYA